ncbi:MAG: hypothetical protein ACK4UN_18280, partial [Limisphaerales bacterium]
GGGVPGWGVCWGTAEIASFLQVQRDADEDVGHRDVYLICCQIDHVGAIESADPDVFIYAVQEVIHLLLSERDAILANLSDQPPEIYAALVESAFRMRELAARQHCAFWTSGYEADRTQLVEVMRRCQLPSDSPDFMPPPHVQHLQRALRIKRESQARQLHKLAQSGQFDKDIRKRLHEIPIDQR